MAVITWGNGIIIIFKHNHIYINNSTQNINNNKAEHKLKIHKVMVVAESRKAHLRLVESDRRRHHHQQQQQQQHHILPMTNITSAISSHHHYHSYTSLYHHSFIQNGFIVSHLAAVKLNCMWFTYIKSYKQDIYTYKFNIVYIIIMHLK